MDAVILEGSSPDGQPSQSKFREKDVTHAGGRGEAFHDWFPYLEGFSSQFVKEILNTRFAKTLNILEPFGGVGTTPIALAQLGISSGYSEVNPFLCELIELKSFSLSLNENQRLIISNQISDLISVIFENRKKQSIDDEINSSYNEVFGKAVYFPEDNYREIIQLKSMERNISNEALRSYFRIAVAATLLPSSYLCRSGDVRFKTEKELRAAIPSLTDLVIEKLELFLSDLKSMPLNTSGKIECVCRNAKELHGRKSSFYDGVITSPPYLNGTMVLSRFGAAPLIA